MNRKDALNIYKSGQDVVVKSLCDMDGEITSLKKTVKSQEITIAKLSKNSSNSSKPPSSDITKPKGKKKKGGKRKIGGQPGHTKHERPLFPEEAINIFHDYTLDVCPDCSGNVILLDLEPRITQQIELQEIVTTKEEHRCYPVWCEKCQKIHYAPLPPDVVKQGLFKARMIPPRRDCLHEQCMSCILFDNQKIFPRYYWRTGVKGLLVQNNPKGQPGIRKAI
jgi:hypothetical protein